LISCAWVLPSRLILFDLTFSLVPDRVIFVCAVGQPHTIRKKTLRLKTNTVHVDTPRGMCTPGQTRLWPESLVRTLQEGCTLSMGIFHSLLWTVTPLRYSCGSRAAGSQSSVFRSNQEMRDGLGPAQPGEGEPVRGRASRSWWVNTHPTATPAAPLPLP
jgi:hypothetical protein